MRIDKPLFDGIMNLLQHKVGEVMRIPLNDILHAPEQKIWIQTTLDYSYLVGEVDQLLDLAPVEVEVEVAQLGDVFYLQGEGNTIAQLSCSRCLEPYTAKMRFQLEETLVERPLTAEEEEADLIQIRDHVIELAPIVESALILSLPYTPLCRDECRGICPHCGTDRNARACSCQEETIDPRWSKLQALLNNDLRN